jgi:hypothetical protein
LSKGTKITRRKYLKYAGGAVVNSRKLAKYNQKRRFEKAAEGWMSLKDKAIVKFVAHGKTALRVTLE